MSRRTERIASLIRRIVAEAIQTRLADPRIAAMTTVTRVEVVDDLSLARVFVSVLSDNEARRKLSVQALSQASGRLRSMLADQMQIRQVPQLSFRLDDSIRRANETLAIIDGLGLSDANDDSSAGASAAMDGAATDAPSEDE